VSDKFLIEVVVAGLFGGEGAGLYLGVDFVSFDFEEVEVYFGGGENDID
jgi:hypothetical protein